MCDEKAIAIYSRKSRFTGKGESIENQIELCRQYITAHEGAAAAASALLYEDEGFSGGNLDRPHFKKMMADAAAGRLSAIIVYRLDRISRNIGDFAALIQRLNDLNISFVSMKEQFDTSSPMGRAMMYIASVFSQLERETIAERIRDNMHELSKTGRWLGGTTPTGYASEQVQRVSVDGKVRKACKLKTIPEEVEVVRTIFSKFLETNSLTRTDAFLLQSGCTTKNGKAFSRFAIRGILSNPVYMVADEDAYRYLTENAVDLFSEEAEFDGKHGVIAYNRTLQKAGKANKTRPMSEWIVSVGKHEGLILGAQWVRAQALLAQNRSKSYRKPRSHVALLSGLLLCGSCGDYMRPKLSSRVDAHGVQIYTYLCSTKERSRCDCCNSKNANGNALDRAVLAALAKLPEDRSELMRQLKRGEKNLAKGEKSSTQDPEAMRAQLADAEQAIETLVSSLTKAAGTAAEDYILRQIQQLHEQRQQLLRRMQQLPAGTQALELAYDTLYELLHSFQKTLEAMTVEQQRAAIRACVQKVVWDGKEAHVYLSGAFDDAATVSGGSKGSAEPLCAHSK
ncbi:recombinase family protein [Oscillibacter sp.]|uniref:recombinase family protein n=1 Tax=Oscillibacter sp. TaxID=1945593 RepID=UPI002606173A|nr:recombinase family protein [Oscillibacter sp.]MDD3347399.1 recombinase family protein [Oscillibacter sp.]